MGLYGKDATKTIFFEPQKAYHGPKRRVGLAAGSSAVAVARAKPKTADPLKFITYAKSRPGGEDPDIIPKHKTFLGSSQKRHEPRCVFPAEELDLALKNTPRTL